MDKATARLAEKPVKTSKGEPFTDRDLRETAANALYEPTMTEAFLEGVAQLERTGKIQDLEVIQTLSNLGGGESDGATVAINCADDPVRPTDPEREYRNVSKQLAAQAPYFGPLAAGNAIACAGFPVGTDYIRNIDKPEGAPKILVIGGKHDPATPYAWAKQTADRLGSGVLMTYEGQGHGAYPASKCVRGKVDRFFADGTVPPHDARSCPAE
ncbi:alpha/beta hydrolase [Streptomyces sp. PA5.6]|uniref:alpha/beta hydrolase n=1 Tax=Streptomyces sp. PA5.6 TaxID=3035651 RepID=UPI00390465EE